MSAFNNARRAPNVSQYIANLNTFPAQDSPQQEAFSPEDDSLALFTNAQFLNDFDDIANVQFGHAEGDAANEGAAGGKDVGGTEIKDLNFDNNGFQFDDMAFGANANGQPNLPPLQALGQSARGYDVAYNSPASYSPVTPHQPQTGDKRAYSTSSDTLEASSRAAAEEDKRRRNTAASARFRVKKKQREQALEKNAKEMNDKIESLENKIVAMERENSILKSLIVDKAAGTKDEIAGMLQKFSEENARSISSAKKGVGTVKAEGEAA